MPFVGSTIYILSNWAYKKNPKKLHILIIKYRLPISFGLNKVVDILMLAIIINTCNALPIINTDNSLFIFKSIFNIFYYRSDKKIATKGNNFIRI